MKSERVHGGQRGMMSCALCVGCPAFHVLVFVLEICVSAYLSCM